MNREKLLKFGMVGSLALLLLGCFGFWQITSDKASVKEGLQYLLLSISVLSVLVGTIGFAISAFSWLVAFFVSRRNRRN